MISHKTGLSDWCVIKRSAARVLLVNGQILPRSDANDDAKTPRRLKSRPMLTVKYNVKKKENHSLLTECALSRHFLLYGIISFNEIRKYPSVPI